MEPKIAALLKANASKLDIWTQALNDQGDNNGRALRNNYECKFGKYHKGQLRELLGLKRHLCNIDPLATKGPILFRTQVVNSKPVIALKLVRPRRYDFFDDATAALHDLDQIIIN